MFVRLRKLFIKIKILYSRVLIRCLLSGRDTWLISWHGFRLVYLVFVNFFIFRAWEFFLKKNRFYSLFLFLCTKSTLRKRPGPFLKTRKDWKKAFYIYFLNSNRANDSALMEAPGNKFNPLQLLSVEWKAWHFKIPLRAGETKSREKGSVWHIYKYTKLLEDFIFRAVKNYFLHWFKKYYGKVSVFCTNL